MVDWSQLNSANSPNQTNLLENRKTRMSVVGNTDNKHKNQAVKIHFTRWLVGREGARVQGLYFARGFSLPEVILRILFLCSRVTSEQDVRVLVCLRSFLEYFEFA